MNWKEGWKFWKKPVDAKDIWDKRVKVLGETPSLGIDNLPEIGKGLIVKHPDSATPDAVGVVSAVNISQMPEEDRDLFDEAVSQGEFEIANLIIKDFMDLQR